jgi:hypothetical protein
VSKVQIVHDWDFPINKPLTNLKLAVWFILEAAFGRFTWFPQYIPDYVRNIKLSHALMMLKVDKMFDVDAWWGLTGEVMERYPEFTTLLADSGVRMIYHYHRDTPELGKGRWCPSIDVSKEAMTFDRRYCVKGKTRLPTEGLVVWHVDHPNNLPKYVEFLVKMKEHNLL